MTFPGQGNVKIIVHHNYTPDKIEDYGTSVLNKMPTHFKPPAMQFTHLY